MRILVTHYCGKERCGGFKFWRELYDVLWHCDYKEQVVSSFSHQIQSEYYGGNRYVYIEGIALEHFSASHHNSPLFASDYVSRQFGFNPFFSDYRKQDAATTNEHSKRII